MFKGRVEKIACHPSSTQAKSAFVNRRKGKKKETKRTSDNTAPGNGLCALSLTSAKKDRQRGWADACLQNMHVIPQGCGVARESCFFPGKPTLISGPTCWTRNTIPGHACRTRLSTYSASHRHRSQDVS